MSLPDTLQLLGFICVGLCWGATNPWIARAAVGRKPVVHPAGRSSTVAWANELVHTLTDWRYVVPLGLNIGGGSVLYFLLLGQSDLSLAVPVTNALTLVFTLLSELGMERLAGGSRAVEDRNGQDRTRLYMGIALVVLGVAVCVRSKES